ncbi:GNAT family N-acetyltransferase [Alteromonadaceae bacterium BrNp21-10]|nr:GNAT family N-acetyltransferase [Alteromonadaceae bacterium BrNp21-10]
MPNFRWLKFNAIDQYLLQAILRLRQNIFIIEQQSIYADIDGYDENCWHLLMQDEQKLAGYLRIRPTNDVLKIERVALEVAWRDQQLGKGLMQRAMQKCQQIDPVGKKAIELAAQTSALSFYQRFGFEPIGEPFDDGGIKHQMMRFSK